jgi:hypothetical protein
VRTYQYANPTAQLCSLTTFFVAVFTGQQTFTPHNKRQKIKPKKIFFLGKKEQKNRR